MLPTPTGRPNNKTATNKSLRATTTTNTGGASRATPNSNAFTHTQQGAGAPCSSLSRPPPQTGPKHNLRAFPNPEPLLLDPPARRESDVRRLKPDRSTIHAHPRVPPPRSSCSPTPRERRPPPQTGTKHNLRTSSSFSSSTIRLLAERATIG